MQRARAEREHEETHDVSEGAADDMLQSIMAELRAIKHSNTELKEDQRLMQAELLRLRTENSALRKAAQSSRSTHHSAHSTIEVASERESVPTPSAASKWVHKPLVGNDEEEELIPSAIPSCPFVIKDAFKPFAILKKVGDDGFFILANHAFCSLYRYTLVRSANRIGLQLLPNASALHVVPRPSLWGKAGESSSHRMSRLPFGPPFRRSFTTLIIRPAFLTSSGTLSAHPLSFLGINP